MNLDPRITFGYADVGEVKLHYAKAGDGERLIVLLHGFPEFWYSWRHQLLDLSDTYTVVAPDLRGYNLSDRPGRVSDYRLETLSDDIAGLVNCFGKETAAIIGHDWGASIAWNVARKHPEIVWKLAALQVPPASVWKRNQTAKQLMASWYMFFFQLPAIPEWACSRHDFHLLADSIRRSTANEGVFAYDDIAEYKTAWSTPGALTAMINYYRANIVDRMWREPTHTSKIAADTLFIYGEKDHAVLPQTVRNVKDAVNGTFREHRIPNSGHWVQQEAADEVTAALRSFLAE